MFHVNIVTLLNHTFYKCWRLNNYWEVLQKEVAGWRHANNAAWNTCRRSSHIRRDGTEGKDERDPSHRNGQSKLTLSCHSGVRLVAEYVYAALNKVWFLGGCKSHTPRMGFTRKKFCFFGILNVINASRFTRGIINGFNFN